MKITKKELEDELIPMEPVHGENHKAPFNGSKFLIIPIKISEAHHYREIDTPQYELLRFIISRYGWKNIIPPTIKNEDIAAFFNIKKSYVEVLISTLKSKKFIVPEFHGKTRRLRIPMYEELLIEFNSNKL